MLARPRKHGNTRLRRLACLFHGSGGRRPRLVQERGQATEFTVWRTPSTVSLKLSLVTTFLDIIGKGKHAIRLVQSRHALVCLTHKSYRLSLNTAFPK